MSLGLYIITRRIISIANFHFEQALKRVKGRRGGNGVLAGVSCEQHRKRVCSRRVWRHCRNNLRLPFRHSPCDAAELLQHRLRLQHPQKCGGQWRTNSSLPRHGGTFGLCYLSGKPFFLFFFYFHPSIYTRFLSVTVSLKQTCFAIRLVTWVRGYYIPLYPSRARPQPTTILDFWPVL